MYRMGTTNHEDADGKVSSVQKPESPASEPPIALFECDGYHSVCQYIFQHRAIIALFYDAGYCNSQLEVTNLSGADIYGVLQTTSQQEECGGIFYAQSGSTASARM